MIDFSTLQCLTIPEGVVKQIAKDGAVLWKLETSKPIILEVEKIIDNTYVSSTSYTNEEFVLLDIYPESSTSVVNITYGGLTKTLTFSGTNAKQVYFGTFGGVSDEVETPTSGTLTIEGDCIGVGCGSYNKNKNTTKYAFGCITDIVEWGGVQIIPQEAFNGAKYLTTVIIPNGVTTINYAAFAACSNLKSVTIPESVMSIGEGAFNIPSLDFNRTVYVLSETPATLGNNGFGISGYTTLVVPKGCGDTYKTAEGWSKYADYIVEAS